MLALCKVVLLFVYSYPLSDIVTVHFIHSCMTRALAYKFYVTPKDIPYTYKLSRDVIFADPPNLGFLRFYFRGSLVITPCTSSVLQLFYKISRI